jgi:hypothetical protein
MRYTPHRVKRENASPHILRLLGTQQTLIVSGTSHQYFDVNKRIGKTSLLRQELSAELQKRGRSVAFFHIGDLIDIESFLFHLLDNEAHFNQRLRSLPEAETYIFDEIHYALPPSEPNPILSMIFPQFNECLLRFWDKIEGLHRSGKKIIFITALHPLNEKYADFLYNPTIALALTSPVVELEADPLD